jgi:hypothetical protein
MRFILEEMMPRCIMTGKKKPAEGAQEQVVFTIPSFVQARIGKR